MAKNSKGNEKLIADIEQELNKISSAISEAYDSIRSLENSDGDKAHWNGSGACESIKTTLKNLKNIEELTKETEETIKGIAK